MSGYQAGDIVGITIKGARVVEVLPDGDTFDLVVDVSARPYVGEYIRMTVASGIDDLTIERVVPAEWPPQAGDLWRDKHGELWFIHKRHDDGGDARPLMGRTADGARWTDNAARLIDDNAPLTLVRRERAS